MQEDKKNKIQKLKDTMVNIYFDDYPKPGWAASSGFSNALQEVIDEYLKEVE